MRAFQHWRAVASVSFFVLLTPQPTVAVGDFDEGLTAYAAANYARARSIWERLAANGDVAAMFNLAVMAAAGRGGPRDPELAVQMYRKAAEGGYAPAQFNLGVAYQSGQGVKPDPAEAAYWWRKAAEQGFTRAQYNLGTLYYYGIGVARDPAQAARWFARAAAAGDRSARRALALLREEAAPEPAAGAVSKVRPKREQPKAEDWLRAQNPDHYTIQLVASHSEQTVLAFARRIGLGAQVAYFRTRRDGKPWYSLVYGHFRNAEEARAALRALAPGLRRHGPWIRSFKSVQRAMDAAAPTDRARGSR